MAKAAIIYHLTASNCKQAAKCWHQPTKQQCTTKCLIAYLGSTLPPCWVFLHIAAPSFSQSLHCETKAIKLAEAQLLVSIPVWVWEIQSGAWILRTRTYYTQHEINKFLCSKKRKTDLKSTNQQHFRCKAKSHGSKVLGEKVQAAASTAHACVSSNAPLPDSLERVNILGCLFMCLFIYVFI